MERVHEYSLGCRDLELAVPTHPPLIFIAAAIVSLSLSALPARAEKAVILVRHAEKADGSRDPALSSEGRDRAERLARLLARAGITHIFNSEFIRTRSTAAPLAESLKIVPTTVPAANERALIDQLRALPADKVALVVGHSNTLPSLLKALGHPVPLTLADDEYGRVFILVRTGAGAPSLIELAY